MNFCAYFSYTVVNPHHRTITDRYQNNKSHCETENIIKMRNKRRKREFQPFINPFQTLFKPCSNPFFIHFLSNFASTYLTSYSTSNSPKTAHYCHFHYRHYRWALHRFPMQASSSKDSKYRTERLEPSSPIFSADSLGLANLDCFRS